MPRVRIIGVSIGAVFIALLIGAGSYYFLKREINQIESIHAHKAQTYEFRSEVRTLHQMATLGSWSGHSSWENKYYQYLAETKHIFPELDVEDSTQEVKQTHFDLISLKNQLIAKHEMAFDLIRADNLSSARNLLYSIEYEKLRNRFTETIDAHFKALDQLEEIESTEYRQILTVFAIVIVISIFVLFSIPFFLLSLLKSWKDYIDRIHQDMEQEIADRTEEAKLTIAQTSHSNQLILLGELASQIGHEINNPLSIISGKASLIKNAISSWEGSATINESLDKISDNCGRISKIVKGLKLLSRNASHDPFERLGFSDVASSAIELCEHKLKTSGVSISTHFDSSLSFMGKPTQIMQVISNLISNSIDAICEQDLTEKWINVEARIVGRFMQIRVTDSGGGIPKEVQEKLLTPFFTTKPSGKGTGLGLYISRKIIAEHHGKLWINNDCANTQFVIELPLVQAPGLQRAS